SGNGFTCTDIDECAANMDNCSANAQCTNTPGSFTCACNTGYSGNGVTCTDINECTAGTDNCQPAETCVNTQGSFVCQCQSPSLMCSGQCVAADSDENNCGMCGKTCASFQVCLASTCVGSGNLGFGVTWTRNGDMDLYVTTPTGKTIYYGNPGPG